MTPQTRPNVLLIFSDQERFPLHLPPLRLPHRQRITRDAITFSHCFCSNPLCSPSRASILTGLWPHQARVMRNADMITRANDDLPLGTPTLGSVFGAAGYDIGYFGKWHLSWRDNLADYGFPEHLTGGEAQNDGYRNDAPVAQAAAEWLSRRTTERPWLCIVSLVNPHDISKRRLQGQQITRPLALPPSLHAPLTGKHPVVARLLASNRDTDYVRKLNEPPPDDDGHWRLLVEQYCDLIEGIDAHLGAVLDGCQAGTGLDSALTIYTSDHGEMAGAHGLVEKFVLYEEAIRVPLVIRRPGGEGAPRQVDTLVSNVDLVPTIASLAGLQWPSPLPGSDLTPLLNGDTGARESLVFAEADSGRRLTPHKVEKPSDVIPFQMRMARTDRWKYILYQDGFEELYDLDTDPHEMDNVALNPSNADVLVEMAQRLGKWQAQTGDAWWAITGASSQPGDDTNAI